MEQKDERNDVKFLGRVLGRSNVMVDEKKMGQFEATLNEILQTLTESEQNVINLRFGLKDNKKRTLEETAKELGFSSPEEVVEIETTALRKLRNPSKGKTLKSFIQ